MAINLTTEQFNSKVLSGGGAYLVDFWAEWCGPCRALAPVLEQIATEFEGKIVVAKLNIDDEPAIAQKYGVMSIPTLKLFVNGAEKGTMVGMRPKNAIVDFINNNL